jgi:hypothetical protein
MEEYGSQGRTLDVFQLECGSDRGWRRKRKLLMVAGCVTVAL